MPSHAEILSDRYRIDHELGAVGMATVYLAEGLRHGRKVALKILHSEIAAALGPERFVAEIAMTATLQHPGILPLFDSGAADGVVFYVMPYIRGESLRARLDREGPRTIGDTVDASEPRAFFQRDGLFTTWDVWGNGWDVGPDGRVIVWLEATQPPVSRLSVITSLGTLAAERLGASPGR